MAEVDKKNHKPYSPVSDHIDSRSVVHEAALCVALEHPLVEGVHISRAMHEPNGGHCRGEVNADFSEASFWRVLHLAVAERPVFPGVVDEIDPDVFFSYAGPLVNLIGYPLIEFFLHLN